LAERAALAAPVFIGAPLLFSVFTGVKSSVSVMVPFWADEMFFALDRAIHFGTDPWQLTDMLFGSPAATIVMDRLYLLWMPYFYAVMVVAALRTDDHLRAQYLAALVATVGLLGMLGATLLASVGPPFYAHFLGADPYADLIAKRAEVGTIASSVQDYLLVCFQRPGGCIGGGIAAAPSMHVATSALSALFLYRVNRWAGYAAWTFAAIIMLGSVHTGWHYAVDGYISIVAVPLIWWLAGRMVAWAPVRKGQTIGAALS
jgi:hypothetical protein